MSSFRRFAAQEQVRGADVAPAHDDVTEAFDPASILASIDLEPAPAPAPLMVEGKAPSEEPVASATTVAEAAPIEARGSTADKPAGALSRLKAGKEASAMAPRTAPDTLALLKSLSPVLRAALLFPGPEAKPEQFGPVVRKLSEATESLAEQIAEFGRDPLELDQRWERSYTRKHVQELAAELVSHLWVSRIIARGGASSDDDGQINIDALVAGAKVALEVGTVVSSRKESLDVSYEGSIRLSFLKAYSPLAIEAEKYAEVVNAKLQSPTVDVHALHLALGQCVMEEALSARDLLVGDAPISDDERRMTLQACLNHVGSTSVSVWELTRGDALGTLVDAPTLEAGRAVLTSPAFSHGFPIDSFRDRLHGAIQRLVGTTQAMMLMARNAIVQPTPSRDA